MEGQVVVEASDGVGEGSGSDAEEIEGDDDAEGGSGSDEESEDEGSGSDEEGSDGEEWPFLAQFPDDSDEEWGDEASMTEGGDTHAAYTNAMSAAAKHGHRRLLVALRRKLGTNESGDAPPLPGRSTPESLNIPLDQLGEGDRVKATGLTDLYGRPYDSRDAVVVHGVDPNTGWLSVQLEGEEEETRIMPQNLVWGPGWISAHGRGNVTWSTSPNPKATHPHTWHLYSAAMLAASKMGHPSVLCALLEEPCKMGPDDCCDQNGQSLLWFAARAGRVEAVRVLIARGGAAVDTMPSRHSTPLLVAAKRGHVETVQVLITEGHANVNMRVGPACVSPLMAASEFGQTDTARLLLAEGAAANIGATGGVTPLHLAADGGHAELVRLLIANGRAEIDVGTTTDGITPLHLAAEHGHAPCVRALVAAGAKSLARTDSGAKPAHMAALDGHTEVMRVLIEDGLVDVDIARTDGATALHLAAQEGHMATARLLLANGADLGKRKLDGCQPLHLASQDGHADMIKMLVIEHGADMNATMTLDDDVCTPLAFTASNNHPQACFALCALGAAHTPILTHHQITRHADLSSWLAAAKYRSPLFIALEARDHAVAEHLLRTRRATPPKPRLSTATPSQSLVDIARHVGTGPFAKPVDALTVRVAEIATELYEGRWSQKANALCCQQQREAVVAMLMIMQRAARARARLCAQRQRGGPGRGTTRQRVQIKPGGADTAEEEYEGVPGWMVRVPEDVWWKVLEMMGTWPASTGVG